MFERNNYVLFYFFMFFSKLRDHICKTFDWVMIFEMIWILSKVSFRSKFEISEMIKECMGMCMCMWGGMIGGRVRTKMKNEGWQEGWVSDDAFFIIHVKSHKIGNVGHEYYLSKIFWICRSCWSRRLSEERKQDRKGKTSTYEFHCTFSSTSWLELLELLFESV